jgi:hypothetical protein
MSNARKCQVLAVTMLFVFGWHSASLAQSESATNTQVVMLGMGLRYQILTVRGLRPLSSCTAPRVLLMRGPVSYGARPRHATKA